MYWIFAASYLVYLFFGIYKNKLIEYLRTIKSKASFDKLYQEVITKKGHFWFKAECYHD